MIWLNRFAADLCGYKHRLRRVGNLAERFSNAIHNDIGTQVAGDERVCTQGARQPFILRTELTCGMQYERHGPQASIELAHVQQGLVFHLRIYKIEDDDIRTPCLNGSQGFDALACGVDEMVFIGKQRAQVRESFLFMGANQDPDHLSLSCPIVAKDLFRESIRIDRVSGMQARQLQRFRWRSVQVAQGRHDSQTVNMLLLQIPCRNWVL
ncbi:MAG: hypothetical protein ABIR27_06040 [Dokdonella sp.]